MDNHDTGNRLSVIGMFVLRYGLVFLLLLFGTYKFFAFEAESIQPLIAQSPVMRVLYSIFDVQQASNFLGVTEIATGLLIAFVRVWPRLSAYASLVAAMMFMTTLSFLFTTKGALLPTSDIGGFLMKDIMLLGASLVCAAEGFSLHALRNI